MISSMRTECKEAAHRMVAGGCAKVQDTGSPGREHWTRLAGAQVDKRKKRRMFIIIVFNLWKIEQINMQIR